uniref:Uncharacterized protein n=1 Tax=Octopus bimaculoides TaxID=37653 RepID=A0A0L8G0H2_OCTBM
MYCNIILVMTFFQVLPIFMKFLKQNNQYKWKTKAQYSFDKYGTLQLVEYLIFKSTMQTLANKLDFCFEQNILSFQRYVIVGKY